MRTQCLFLSPSGASWDLLSDNEGTSVTCLLGFPVDDVWNSVGDVIFIVRSIPGGSNCWLTLITQFLRFFQIEATFISTVTGSKHVRNGPSIINSDKVKQAEKNISFSFSQMCWYCPHTNSLHMAPTASKSISMALCIQKLPNWCTNPVTKYCSAVESAQSKHNTQVINELLLKQESGAGLTEHLWTIDQGREVHTPELQTFGLKQHCFLI